MHRGRRPPDRRVPCDNGGMTTRTFTRMDESTAAQWSVIGQETMEAQPQVADHMLALLDNLEGMVMGFAVD